ncbi:glycerol kinase [Thiospirochaeta perfilievii]|uniref:Glycerol kinase n=1 Tax=Thiospirochaeta perfilievii TaxID=252967 RepID=A0A5C1QCB1_9SPIO|nr:glycerol kinase GlpK [Thiospirochaeta perfilievii]QEN05745.1 glycerol kinase [Thiospirochaeta perfilievii]
MTKYIISLDQGTTSSRSVIINHRGEIVDINQKEIKQYYPKNGWVEEDPLEIYESQIYTLKSCLIKNNILPDQIYSVGITNQRETTILWNKKTGKPVYNAIVWQCKRSSNICDELRNSGYADMIHKITGLILDPYFSATKIKWILDNIDGVRDEAEEGNILFGTVDTWLLWMLTDGQSHYTDVSNASRTMLFNINTKKWDDDLLDILDIPRTILPEIKPTAYHFGNISNSIFEGSIPIHCLIGDQQSALFGQLCTDIGDIKNTYGTGCFTLMNTGEKPVFSNNGLLTTVAWEYDNRCYYAIEGSVFVGGAVIQWIRDELGIIKNASESNTLAKSVQDNNGVIFISTFQGVGTPYWCSNVKAQISGLSRSTKKAHIVRAALESIAFRTMEVINTMELDSEIKISSLKVDGGACRNDFLMEFQSGISNVDIVRPTNTESTALGAAYMAGLYSKFWKDIYELKHLKKTDRTFKPSMDSKTREKRVNEWSKAIKKAIGD